SISGRRREGRRWRVRSVTRDSPSFSGGGCGPGVLGAGPPSLAVALGREKPGARHRKGVEDNGARRSILGDTTESSRDFAIAARPGRPALATERDAEIRVDQSKAVRHASTFADTFRSVAPGLRNDCLPTITVSATS